MKNKFIIKTAVLLCILALAFTFFATSAQSGTASDSYMSLSATAPSEVDVGETFKVTFKLQTNMTKVHGIMGGYIYRDSTQVKFVWIYPSSTGAWKYEFPQKLLTAGDYVYSIKVMYWPKNVGQVTNTLTAKTDTVKVVNPYELDWLPPVSEQDKHNAGRTIPIKFRVTKDDVFVKDTSVKVTVSQGTTTVFSAKYPDVSIRGTNHYHVNWDSDKDDTGDFVITAGFSNGFKETYTITLK
jgi:hypothetical protein